MRRWTAVGDPAREAWLWPSVAHGHAFPEWWLRFSGEGYGLGPLGSFLGAPATSVTTCAVVRRLRGNVG
eukprot:4690500-Alexandrium_andersonii.AAC.1